MSLPEREILLAQLEEHRAARPEMPRPVPSVDDPAYQEWRRSYQAWVDRKQLLLGLLAGADMPGRMVVIPGPQGYVKRPSEKGIKRGRK